METILPSPLTSLTVWSMQHICDIFQASNDEDALRALENTFARNIEASVNGKSIEFSDIQGMVLALRKGSQLKVLWQQARESPSDPSTNRSGLFNGMYMVQGIQRLVPGSNSPVEFERHKTVQVRIESQSKDTTIDSRRIVKLNFVANDVRVHRDRQASL